MADEQQSGVLTEPQESTGLNSMEGLIDQAGLARIFAGQEATEPEPTQPEEEAEREISEPDVQSSSEESEAGETEENALSQQESDEAEDDRQDGLLKRINKLTAIRRQAEDRADQAEGQIESLKSEIADLRQQVETRDNRPAPPRRSGKYSELETVNEVDRKLEETQEINDWAEMNPLGVVEGDNDYSAEEIAKIKVNSRKAMRDLSARKEQIILEQQNSNMVSDAFPYWNDKSSQMYQQAMEIVRNRPEIKASPTWKMDVTMYQLGLMAFQEMMNQKKSPKAPKKAPSQPAAPSAAPKQKSKPTARDQFLKSGGRTSLTEVMKELI